MDALACIRPAAVVLTVLCLAGAVILAAWAAVVYLRLRDGARRRLEAQQLRDFLDAERRLFYRPRIRAGSAPAEGLRRPFERAPLHTRASHGRSVQ